MGRLFIYKVKTENRGNIYIVKSDKNALHFFDNPEDTMAFILSDDNKHNISSSETGKNKSDYNISLMQLYAEYQKYKQQVTVS